MIKTRFFLKIQILALNNTLLLWVQIMQSLNEYLACMPVSILKIVALRVFSFCMHIVCFRKLYVCSVMQNVAGEFRLLYHQVSLQPVMSF